MNIKRSYLVSNKNCDVIRAWHGHKFESKYFLVIKGGFQISTVKVDNFKKPSKKNTVSNYFLKDNTGDILFVPGGYANGFKALYAESILQIFSTSSLEESLNDDYRYPFDYWNAWDEKNF
jgi:dTDP-4-dehydrorhamnose 3,5-epimerase-like enzyme